jgi:hypothetical protein
MAAASALFLDETPGGSPEPQVPERCAATLVSDVDSFLAGLLQTNRATLCHRLPLRYGTNLARLALVPENVEPAPR